MPIKPEINDQENLIFKEQQSVFSLPIRNRKDEFFRSHIYHEFDKIGYLVLNQSPNNIYKMDSSFGLIDSISLGCDMRSFISVFAVGVDKIYVVASCSSDLLVFNRMGKLIKKTPIKIKGYGQIGFSLHTRIVLVNHSLYISIPQPLRYSKKGIGPCPLFVRISLSDKGDPVSSDIIYSNNVSLYGNKIYNKSTNFISSVSKEGITMHARDCPVFIKYNLSSKEINIVYYSGLEDSSFIYSDPIYLDSSDQWIQFVMSQKSGKTLK